MEMMTRGARVARRARIMESRVRVFGHSFHQIAVSFPIGTLAFGAVCDAAHALRGRRSWRSAGQSAIGAGLVGAGGAGLILTAITAWLGAELINRLGVGVYEPTSLDAPPSTTAAHARLELGPIAIGA
jgi:uncharacterized membrane protein